MWISKFEFQIYLKYRPMFTNSQEMFVCLFPKNKPGRER